MDLSRLTPDLLTSLPVDRRAVEILRAITRDEPRDAFFNNRRNIRLTLEQRVWEGAGSFEASRAYNEALIG